MKRILVADNNKSFLKAFTALLSQAGYDVLAAEDSASAERALRESHVHLAILDVRLDDDSDRLDKSGLALAKKEAYSRVPKIILTNFPDYPIVREAFADVAAVDFLAKEQDADIWIETVDRSFEKHVKVNWDVKVSATESAPGFAQLCEFASPGLKGDILVERTAELEEIFRRLFYLDEAVSIDEIRIDKLLWKRGDRVALVVSSFSQESLPHGYVVICGPRNVIHDETSRFSKYKPRDSGPSQTVLQRTAETVHFGGACYTLAGASLEDLQPLNNIYVASEKFFHSSLKSLFSKTLRLWHEESRLIDEERTLDELYREHLALGEAKLSRERFKAKIESLASRLPILGTRFDFSDGTVTLDIRGHVRSYPDPIVMLYSTFDFSTPVPMIITPGGLSTDTVLAGESDGLWLTDFATTGPAPLAWNHVALEAAIRFDMVRSTNLSWLYQMEQALIETDFSRLYAEDMEGPTKKAVRAIQIIRKDAIANIGGDIAAYHLGIFFQAASRLAAYNPGAPMRDKELAPFAHMLLAMCMIGAQLRERKTQKRRSATRANPIAIDIENRRVFIEGVPISLKGKGYQLLCFLYDRAGRLCDRKELFEAVFDETYDAADDNQQSKLNTAIHRLREKIEDDAEKPKYLLTDPGGYRLLLTEKK